MGDHIRKNEEQELESMSPPIQKNLPPGPVQENLEPLLRLSCSQDDKGGGPQLAPDSLIVGYKVGKANPLTVY